MNYQTIGQSELKQKMERDSLNNQDPETGVTLVNVLGSDMYDEKHIPNSINIPVDELDEFNERFARDKEIVVYCASTDCDASPRAAEALIERGFTRVFDYEGGMADWEQHNQPIAGRAATANRTPS